MSRPGIRDCATCCSPTGTSTRSHQTTWIPTIPSITASFGIRAPCGKQATLPRKAHSSHECEPTMNRQHIYCGIIALGVLSAAYVIRQVFLLEEDPHPRVKPT